MQIIYQKIDENLINKIDKKYGKTAKDHIHTEDGSFSLAAVYDDDVIGFISTYTRNLTEPIAEEKDAYIDIIEVENEYQRIGIATELIKRTEEWALKSGLLQINAWSSQDKTEAIPMWLYLGYGLCPAKIWIEWCKEAVNGYYVVKQLNPINPFPEITKLIKSDTKDFTSKAIQNFRLIRAKTGVYVYRCIYDGKPAVVKYFENEDDKREILNYKILSDHGVPTMKHYMLGKATLVLEDISISNDWRLGVAEDLNDIDVAKCLADWYFLFHENGVNIPELCTLYFEFDMITIDNLEALILKIPDAEEFFRFLINHFEKLREIIYKPSFTTTYNDFYWTNFVVRKDKQAAMMFDYNLLGRGYRSSDFRNVCSSLSEESAIVFTDKYNKLYLDKYGEDRTATEIIERKIDNVMSPVHGLIVACLEREDFPDWAEFDKKEAINGNLLHKAKQLLQGD